MHSVSLILLLATTTSMLLCVRSEYGKMLAPPERPTEFTSATQLRKYLAALNEYYSIMGRPRFGKRSEGFSKRGSFRTSGDSFSDDAPSWSDLQQWSTSSDVISWLCHRVPCDVIYDVMAMVQWNDFVEIVCFFCLHEIVHLFRPAIQNNSET